MTSMTVTLTSQETERAIEMAIERATERDYAAAQLDASELLELDEVMRRFAAVRTLVRLTSSEEQKVELLGKFIRWMRDPDA